MQVVYDLTASCCTHGLNGGPGPRPSSHSVTSRMARERPGGRGGGALQRAVAGHTIDSTMRRLCAFMMLRAM